MPQGLAPPLSERQQEVLLATVAEYIRTKSPVGSKQLKKQRGFEVSSATIRNELAFLDEAGYLHQPHTSAGRIPESRAYRLYVNRLDEEMLSDDAEEVRVFDSICRRLKDRPRMLMRTISRNLADLTGLPGILMTPASTEGVFEDIAVTPVSSNNVMFKCRTDQGTETRKLLPTPRSMTADEITLLSRALKKLYRGRPARELATLTSTALAASVSDIDVPDKLITALRRAVDLEDDREIFVEGTSYILDEPEFQTHSSLRDVIEILDQQALLREALLPAMDTHGVAVAIGTESGLQGMRNCSLITRSYKGATNQAGTLGVLGPLSMDYRRTMPLVGFIARRLSHTLSGHPEDR